MMKKSFELNPKDIRYHWKIIGKLLESDEYEIAENIAIKIIVLESKEKFHIYRFLIFLFYEQKKIKEMAALVKYCKEKFPENAKEITIFY